jgi:integrating conjugative element protein (TIGR03759 family)
MVVSNGRNRMISRLRPVIVYVALLVSSATIAAELSHTRVTETGQEDASTAESALSATELARARIWGMSETEWHRYRQLMQGIRGSVSPSTLSPLEVLGIHARDEAERQRYAEAWVRAMRDDVDRILAFQRAYDAAGKRLYPNEPLIDVNRLPGRAEARSPIQSTDRVLFFTRTECAVCDAMWNKLMKRFDDIPRIDVYLTDVAPGDDAAVRAWASRHRIDLEWVRSRRITLNHDAGALDRLTKGQGNVPYLLRRRGEALSPLRASDL